MVTYQQEGFFERQSALLKEQNELLKQVISVSNNGDREIYIDNIDHDEMRDGFLVTSQRKKLWNVQIGLIKEFERICKKHGLRWFAIGGTLMGAARHKGFIPWDDDVDVAMLRPEYEKLRKIIASEIKPPYHLDIWYDYRLEIDDPSDLTDNSLPLVSRRHQEKHPHGAPFFPLIKIRDERTLFVEFPDETSFNQSMWIDVFPLDSIPPFDDKQQRLDFEIVKIFFIATTHPEMIKDTLQKNQSLIVDDDTLLEFMSLPYKERGLRLEKILSEKFSMSKHVGDLRGWCILQNQRFYQSKDFRNVEYLPFEKIEVPAPVNYESVLTDFYGDWRTPVKTHTHSNIYSAEISWEEYLRKQH